MKLSRSIRTALAILIIAVLSVSLAACGSKGSSANTQKSAENAARTVTDSCGRQVSIPSKITKIAPSGVMAQIVLYTLCPDKLVGLSSNFSEVTKKYIDKKYWDLPKFGQFYGKNVSLNMEALAAAAPDVIIDIGQAKPTIKDDMDGLQKQLGIPVLFVEATQKTMDKAYTMLGDFVGEQKQAEILSAYCKNTIEDISKKSASIPEKDKITIYYALGNEGLNTNAAGSIHADDIEAVGAVNAANVQLVSSGAGSIVTMEQIMKWNPNVIITAPNGIYNTISSDKLWQSLNAVKSGKIYEIPNGPFNWIGDPPSVNRIIGLKWLGNLVYPNVYKYDMAAEAKDFYSKFYHINLSSDQINELLKNSTYKK